MFEIRNATVTDIPLIRELTYKVWPQTYVNILSAEQIDYMLEMMYSTASLEKQCATEFSEYPRRQHGKPPRKPHPGYGKQASKTSP